MGEGYHWNSYLVVSFEFPEYLTSHLWLPQVIENYFNLYIQVTTLDKVRNAGREILLVQIVSFKWRLIVPNRLNYSGTCSRVKYNDKINIGIFYFII